MSGYDDLQMGLRLMSERGLDDPEAQGLLQRALDSGELDQEDAATSAGALGSAYHATGRQEEALVALELAAKLSRDPAKLAIVHYDLGETLFVLGREEEAEPHYRTSLAHDRRHPWAPDTMLLLARAIYFRTHASRDVAALNEAHGLAIEAYELLSQPEGGGFGTFNSPAKTQFDALFIAGVTKSEMPRDNDRFEAAEFYALAEQLAVAYREEITDEELANVYNVWVALLEDMGLRRDAILVRDRAKRAGLRLTHGLG